MFKSTEGDDMPRESRRVIKIASDATKPYAFWIGLPTLNAGFTSPDEPVRFSKHSAQYGGELCAKAAELAGRLSSIGAPPPEHAEGGLVLHTVLCGRRYPGMGNMFRLVLVESDDMDARYRAVLRAAKAVFRQAYPRCRFEGTRQPIRYPDDPPWQ